MGKYLGVPLFIGLDVQVRRPCSYYLLDKELEYVDSGWLAGSQPDEICHSLEEIISGLEITGQGQIAIGIDAPRMGLDAPREYYWRGNAWQQKSASDKGSGRHCEVIIKALGIANPQWTPLKANAPAWMQLGFELFHTLDQYEHVYEVFPSASYSLLINRKTPTVSLSFANFARGPKDMLDACISAFTVHQFVTGRGSEVGGGDGLGTIVLPTSLPVPASHPVLRWSE